MTVKASVLLVDDDQDLLSLMSMRVAAAGYRPITASSGQQALDKLAIERPQVVVTDLRMEPMDGLRLFDLIAQSHPALPVIILTAHGSIPDAVTATRRGAYAFLTKPFDGEALLSYIEQAVRISGAGFDGGIASVQSGWRSEIITRNPQMEELLSRARMVAESNASVILIGASGTGKEVLAKAIHKASPRREGEFVALNCGAIPEPLLESELFGYSKGAFTGATRDYPGLFQTAHNGTLFLDEIGDMPAALQVKLLRVLQDKQVRPLGALRPIAADVRIVSATHRDLEAEVEAGRFRLDLFYRINVAPLDLPPLDRRREDIPLLAAHCLARLCAEGGKSVRGFATEALELLLSAPWPGNIRQLFNVVEQAHAFATTPLISAAIIRTALRAQPASYEPLEQARARFEKDYLVKLLKITDGNVSLASRMAQRNRTDFHKLLRRHGLESDAFRPDTP
ncbi:MAG: two-component system response regulator GlrR [Gammaproteobacteria bacterium]